MKELNYEFTKINFQDLKNNVLLPSFQRNLVWKKDIKLSFINTVLDGDPFGSLLLYKDHKSGKYIIIDGLQRYSTLVSFANNPFEYISIDIQNFVPLERISKLLYTEYQNTTLEYIQEFIVDITKEAIREFYKEKDPAHSFVPNYIIKKIEYIYPISSSAKFIIKDDLSEFWDNYKQIININKLSIPYIEYKGDFSHLPDIFERLNTGGTKLTKYEVFSSSWNNINLKLLKEKPSIELLKKVEAKYEYLMDTTEIEIDGFEENEIVESGNITLYEFIFGLGKLIISEAKVITNYRRIDISKDESIAFSTVASILGLHLKDLQKLDRYINSSISPLVLNKFVAIILRCYKEVDEMLKMHFDRHFKYIEAQVISIVTTWFNINYKIDRNTLEIERNQVINDRRNIFEELMPQRLLYDILGNYWSGSGDNKLYDIITGDMNNNRYLKEIDVNNWSTRLAEWVEDQTNSSSKTISIDNRMVYSYAISDYKTDKSNYKHAIYIPKNKQKNHLPQGHLGNVIFVSDSDELDIKNIFKYNEANLKKRHFPYSISFEDSNSISDEEYMLLVKTRANIIIDRFLKVIDE